MEDARFFQWVDDIGHYSSSSILSRLITRPNRVIRKRSFFTFVLTSHFCWKFQGSFCWSFERHEDTEEAYEQEELDKVEDLKIVRAKWFVPGPEGECYRLPARVMPKVRLDTQHDILSKFSVEFFSVFFWVENGVFKSGI